MGFNHNIQHIVLLNGWSATSRLWDDFFDASFDSCTVEIIDLDEHRTLADYCQLLDRHMQEATLLIGWSLGGALALHYAASYSSEKQKNCLKAVVALQTSPCFVEREDWSAGMGEHDFLSLQSVVEKNDRDLLVKRFGHLMVSGSEHHKQDRLFLKACYLAEGIPQQCALEGGLAILNQLDLRAVMGSVEVPNLWVFGAKDRLVSVATLAYMQSLRSHERLDNGAGGLSRFEVIEQMGHLPCGAYRDEVRNIILNYLDAL